MTGPKPVAIPWSDRLDDLRRGPFALALWILAAFGAWHLLHRQEDQRQFLALAQSVEAEVSSEVDGRLTQILVTPFEQVTAGQPIAQLDDARVLARIESVQAEVSGLEAEVDAMRAAFEREATLAANDSEYLPELRRFQLDVQQPRIQRLELAVQVESDTAEIARVELRLERATELAEQGNGPAAERDDLKLRRAQLEARIAAARRLADELREIEGAAVARLAAFEAQAPVPLELAQAELLPLRERVREANLRVQEIQVERRSLTLVAPLSGKVRRVLAGSGQAILAGESVATITGAHAETVLAYLPAGSSEAIPGKRVSVQRPGALLGAAGAAGSVVEAVVARLGPVIEQLPEQLWLDPVRPEFGRPVIVAGVSGLGLTPGEVAVVRLLE